VWALADLIRAGWIQVAAFDLTYVELRHESALIEDVVNATVEATARRARRVA